MEIITSTENNKVKLWNNLKQKKYRDKYGLFIVQERHLIEEAIKANLVDTLILREGVTNQFEMNAIYVSDNVMKKLSENVSLNDCIAICKMVNLETNILSRVVILERVQDPGNVGTIIRTAYSFGYDAVLLTKECADIYNEKTIQSSQGSLFFIPVIKGDLEELVKIVKDNGCELVATDLYNSNYLSETKVSDKYAIMMGNEGKGLSQKAIDLSDKRVKIEMDNFESLNVAVAASICMYNLKYMSKK